VLEIAVALMARAIDPAHPLPTLTSTAQATATAMTSTTDLETPVVGTVIEMTAGGQEHHQTLTATCQAKNNPLPHRE
ncbi:MAG: hypothetical protein LQ340_007358, partial [Diploschistes diacapsis]